MYRAPAEVDLTKPAIKDDRVVEPLEAMVKAETPEDEATLRISVVGRVEVPWTDRVATGVEEPMPTKPLALTVK